MKIFMNEVEIFDSHIYLARNVIGARIYINICMYKCTYVCTYVYSVHDPEYNFELG